MTIPSVLTPDPIPAQQTLKTGKASWNLTLQSLVFNVHSSRRQEADLLLLWLRYQFMKYEKTRTHSGDGSLCGVSLWLRGPRRCSRGFEASVFIKSVFCGIQTIRKVVQGSGTGAEGALQTRNKDVHLHHPAIIGTKQRSIVASDAPPPLIPSGKTDEAQFSCSARHSGAIRQTEETSTVVVVTMILDDIVCFRVPLIRSGAS